MNAGTPAVLHVVAPAPFGGIESVVQALAHGRHDAGRRVLVATLLQDDAPQPFVERLRHAGVPVAEVRCGRRRYAAEVRAVSAIIRDNGIGVVHSHNYHADIVALRAARRSRVPVVTTVHGFSDGSFKNRVYEWLDRRLLRFFDRVICVSDDTSRRVLRAGCPPERVVVVQNGYAAQPMAPRFDARSQLGLAEDDTVVGWVGRLSPAKGPDLLVEAVARLAPPEAFVVVVGDGPERESMLERRNTLGIPPERLRLVGERENAAHLFPAFDVFVLSSRNEGTPMALLEAMAAGVPVVSFAVGGVPSVLGDTGGWLVRPGDTAALGDAINEAIARPDEATRRAANARAILDERFGLAQWTAKVEAVYESVLAG